MPRVWLVLCLGLAACDARSLGGRDGGAPEAAAPRDAVDAAEASGVCSSPSICNEDPQLSTLAGKCVPLFDSWYCECNEGFSNNIKTGKCRAGSMCVAAGADPWATSITFDTSDCATRVPSCENPIGGPPLTVNDALFGAAMRECHLPALTFLRIVYENGCAVSLQINGLGNPPIYPDLVPCLTKLLQSRRWTCPKDTGCALLEWDTLP
jgi:hypothetical protein